MENVISFPQNNTKYRAGTALARISGKPKAGGKETSAQILLFTGVRYQRDKDRKEPKPAAL